MYDDLMVVAAFRYCLGRRTYIVGHCVSWLMANWTNLEERSRECITRELAEEIERDNNARGIGCDWHPLGDDCDRAEWLKLQEFIGEANK